MADDLARFEEKFTKTERGCWEWDASKLPTGYGLFRFGGWMQRAHRMAYRFYVGPIPDGQCVLHRCDNPSCVRPDHLWLGTQADNVRDMHAKGRATKVRGVRQWQARMNVKMVEEMRRAYARGGVTARELARRFGQKEVTVRAALLGRTWKHAGGPIHRPAKQNKLTERQRRRIVVLRERGLSYSRIAAEVGCHQSYASKVARRYVEKR